MPIQVQRASPANGFAGIEAATLSEY